MKIKKSQLKSLIREVLKEMVNQNQPSRSDLDTGIMKAVNVEESIDEREQFDLIPIGTYFRIPGMDNLFKKSSETSAKDFGKKPTIKNIKPPTIVKIQGDTLVLISPINIKEETSSGAVFSGGPTIQTPAWGTKNKMGSPGAIKAAKKYGTIVKSISEENK